MTIRDRILDHLQQHPEVVDDDFLAMELLLSRRQTANQECRKLEAQGIIERRKVAGNTRNFLIRGPLEAIPELPQEGIPCTVLTSNIELPASRVRPWH